MTRTVLRIAAMVAATLAALLCQAVGVAHASTSADRFSFAVIGNVPHGPTEEASVRAMLDNIADGDAAFIIHDGNLKGEHEACSDALLSERIALLNSSAKPLIYVPGDNDWTDCGLRAAGGFNAIARLDFLRDHAFGQDTSLGQQTLPLLRQSDLARFRQYRENVRWRYRDIVFVGLNVPGGDNNYHSGGGRNGEFDDRVIANRMWLNHALIYAKQQKARGMVVIVQADPEFRNARQPSAWRRWFERQRGRGHDPYMEFRHDLAKLAKTFKRPILLIHGGTDLRIDHPLRDAHGAEVTNLTRLMTYGSPIANRWVRVSVDPRQPALFDIETRPALRRPVLHRHGAASTPQDTQENGRHTPPVK